VDALSFDRAACLTSSAVAAILDDLQATQETPHAAAATGGARGWSVVVIVTPAAPGDGLDHLTQCDRDCLALLAQCSLPVPVVRVRKLLEQRGIGVWGEATVKRSLSRLRRLKLVSNSRSGQRGYFLPESSPIVRKAAG
jgi:hypothetical protein